MMKQNKKEKNRLEEIRDLVIGDHPDRLNEMLDPEPCGFDPDERTSEIRFRMKEWEKNQRGEAHGGAIASLFDTAMGMSAAAFSGKNVSTADLQISFIRPFTGTSYIIRTEGVHMGRKLMRLTAKAYDEETGKCLASACGNFVSMGEIIT